MKSFSQRLAARLGDNARITQGVVAVKNTATPQSIEALRHEIAVKVSANEAMCNKSLQIAAKMPLK